MSEKPERELLLAEMIIEVRAGKLTARDAARRLGVSTKTYYKWEKRGLGGLVGALKTKNGGRPAPKKDHEKEVLREERDRFREQALIWQQRCRIRELLAEGAGAKKKEGFGGRGGARDAKTARRDRAGLPGTVSPDEAPLLYVHALAGTPAAEPGDDRDPGAEEVFASGLGAVGAGDRQTASREKADGRDGGVVRKTPVPDLAEGFAGEGGEVPQGASAPPEEGDETHPLADPGSGLGDG